MYHSQYKQDKFLDRIVFNGKKNGFFVDIGAHNGVSFSNTFFFENKRNWKGVCVEPNPNVFYELEQNRASINLNICIGESNRVVNFNKIEGYAEMLSGVADKYASEHLSRIQKAIAIHGGSIQTIAVEMKRFDSVEEISNKHVDFVSIDTEGNELDIVMSIDFKNSDIVCFVIENNYNDNQISEFFKKNEYKHIAKLRCDDFYIHKKHITFFLKFRLILWRIMISMKKRSVKLFAK